jgi:hypothetical protein
MGNDPCDIGHAIAIVSYGFLTCLGETLYGNPNRLFGLYHLQIVELLVHALV